MGIGSKVRRMFGRHERLVTDAWRAGFIDLNHFIEQVHDWVPHARRILEIGCGEGAGTERLAAAYPEASILAIDITENLGRLYRGRMHNVAFRRAAVTELCTEPTNRFDLIVMCDVLHHVPPEMRAGFVVDSAALLNENGSFVFKDWGRAATPIHWIAYAADRWLTGDRVSFLTQSEAESFLAQSSSAFALRRRATIRPWRNNFALLMQRPQ